MKSAATPRFTAPAPLRALLPDLLVVGLVVALAALRAHAVDQQVGRYVGCPDCFTGAVFAGDLLLLALVSGLLLLAGLQRLPGLGRVLHLAVAFLILAQFIDLVLFRLFNARLFMTDAAVFVHEREAIWDQFQGGVGGPVTAWLLVAAVIGFLTLMLWKPPARRAPQRYLLGGVLLGSLAFSAAVPSVSYVNDWAVQNVLEANHVSAMKNPYTPAYLAHLPGRTVPVHSSDACTGGMGRGRKEPKATRRPRLGKSSEASGTRGVALDACRRAQPPSAQRAGAGKRDSFVIVVLLESWSTWHSKLFGGFEDWTPRLDAAARRGLRFEHMHAIGFSTDKGLMGVLAGEPLWAPFIHWHEATPFHSMWGIQDSLPRVFTRAGYHTAFLTTGPLGLYRKGEWLEDLGFEHVEGREQPFYEGWPKFSFGSAPDRALYQRAEQWRAAAAGPWLLVLETVSTHQPYRDPDSGKKSLELAMKYADREFAAYLDSLDRSGFFEKGVLLVLGDHRSMTPIAQREFERFGNEAWSLVPAFVVGKGFAAGGVDRNVWSQSDIAPTFDWWLNGRPPTAPWDGLMFPREDGGAPRTGRPDKCAFHRRGNQRGLVDVICNAGQGVVQLDGDNTRFIESVGLDDALRANVLADIARIRMQELARHRARTAAPAPAP